MANELLAVSNGEFTLSKTENENHYYFYRNDGGVLTAGTEREMIDMYRAYIMHEMVEGKITDNVNHRIYAEMSSDGKCIRLTICDIGKEPTNTNNSTVNQKQPNFLKRLFHKTLR